MPIVYRIETADNKGICRIMGSGICRIYADAGGIEHEHDTITQGMCVRCHDCLVTKMEAGWPFAFPTMQAMLRWFPDANGRAAMAKAGAQLVGYDCPADAIRGNNDEVIFDITRATELHRAPLM